MSHAAEGALQAYLDDEIDSAAAATLRAHLASCAACASELNALRVMNERAHDALALLDAPAPMVRAQAALAGTRRPVVVGDSRGFLKAAMLLLALAGAGGAAIIPGSPLRPWLQSTFARVAQLFGADAPASAPDAGTPPAGPTEVSNVSVAAANGRIRVQLLAPRGDVTVVVRTTDDALVNIDTRQETGTVRMRSATGRAELSDVVDATVTIGIPRTVTSASIEVDGVAYVFKRNGRLQRSDESTTTSTARVRFEIQD